MYIYIYTYIYIYIYIVSPGRSLLQLLDLDALQLQSYPIKSIGEDGF